MRSSHPHCVKYLCILIDDKLAWYDPMKYVIKLCSQLIGVFKKVLLYLPNDGAILYYTSFIQSCFSYCTVFWFNNAHSSRQKLIDKVDKIITIVVNRNKNKRTQNDFVNCIHNFSRTIISATADFLLTAKPQSQIKHF